MDFREPVLYRSLRIALHSCFERNTGPGRTWRDFLNETRGYIVVSTRTLCKAMKTWFEANVSDTRTWKNLFAYSWRENCLKFTDSTTMPLPRPLWDMHMTWSNLEEAKPGLPGDKNGWLSVSQTNTYIYGRKVKSKYTGEPNKVFWVIWRTSE